MGWPGPRKAESVCQDLLQEPEVQAGCCWDRRWAACRRCAAFLNSLTPPVPSRVRCLLGAGLRFQFWISGGRCTPSDTLFTAGNTATSCPMIVYQCIFFFCFWKLRLQVVMLRVTVVSASGGHTDCFVSVLSSRLLLDWFWKPVRLPTFS